MSFVRWRVFQKGFGRRSILPPFLAGGGVPRVPPFLFFRAGCLPALVPVSGRVSAAPEVTSPGRSGVGLAVVSGSVPGGACAAGGGGSGRCSGVTVGAGTGTAEGVRSR